MSALQTIPAPAGPALRILHINSMLKGGGTDDQCVKLVVGLNKRGQAASIYGPEGREFTKVIRELAVPFHPSFPEGPAKLGFIVQAARLIRRERIQIVHGHHGRDLWPTVLAARLSGVRPKVVLTRHLAKSPASWASRRFLLDRCDALIAVSEFVATVLREGVYEPDSPVEERRSRPPLHGDHAKIHVIHGGIDTDRFRPADAAALRTEWNLAPENFVFAVVGGYDGPRGKGQREFLQAAARICGEVPQARFLIVGRGTMEHTLRADIERLGLAGQAWLTPYCHDMPAAMNAIDCLVHPQVATEAFALVVCEASACGKPVIASALDGIPEAFAIASHGELVPPESVPALAEAMRRWAQHPAPTLAERLRLHRVVANRCSLDSGATAVLKLYRQLVPAASVP